MAPKPNGKRAAPSAQGPSKKRKVAPATSEKPKLNEKQKATKLKEKSKDKLADRGVIPIPAADRCDDEDLSDQDMQGLEEYGGAVAFLGGLDEKGISRSKKEQDRLHRMSKPVKVVKRDNLPSIEDSSDEGSDTEGQLPLSLSDSEPETSDDEDAHVPRPPKRADSDDEEMEYETAGRKRDWEPEANLDVESLPIKLANGRIQKTGTKAGTAPVVKPQEESESEEEEEKPRERPHGWRLEDVATGARFGRPAVVDVIGLKTRKARIGAAKDQIAGICQEIVADPENSLGLLRRLHSFSLTEITTPAHPDPVKNDVMVRKLAILSQLAVFKDIIPGYRIRELTVLEKAEKVSQMVSQTRDYEQGLVMVYQQYLRALEHELKDKTELAETALHCMCTLALEATHFNFMVNLMSCIVARLSKRSWDQSSDLCLNTLIKVFKADMTGLPSLEVVRLINRMVKEKRFNIHPEVLSCLLHLRLKTELGVRASESKIDREERPKEKVKTHSKGRAESRRSKGKATDTPHLSKKGQKALKEKKEIDKEFRDAEAEVDKDERAVTHTETLKLLFVLYFRIIKNPRTTPLLPAALKGISKYAHMVNIDFFKDLLKVLKDLITRENDDDEDEELEEFKDARDVQHRLLCIVTAFELLSGQGEALNIDLSDFIARLYGIILPLSLMPDIETPPAMAFKSEVGGWKAQSTIDMLFRALNIVFNPRTFGSAAPPWRSAAFAKRILTASLHWPPNSALRAIDFVGGLVAKDGKLEALMSTDDRTFDGVYRPDLEDPQLANPFGTSFWELHSLQRDHWDERVRKEAKKLSNFVRS